MKRFAFLTTGLWLLVSGISNAILDTNNNGFSDIFERQYNDGNLFASTTLPEADDDKDGWSNIKEAAAGTNPFDPKPPAGIVTVTIAPSLTEGAFTLSWPTIVGKSYQLKASTDLAVWSDIGDPITTFVNSHTIGVNTVQPDTTIAPKVFWRVNISDLDTDNDGLTNTEEHALGTDFESPNSIPGVPDLWLAQHFTNALLTGGIANVNLNDDPDNDGYTSAEEHLNNTNPNNADAPSSTQWIILRGDSEQNVEKTRTKTFTIAAGKSALLAIAIASDEFPYFTNPENTYDYDDRLRWNITPHEQTAINGSVQVNSRHYEWEIATLDQQYLSGVNKPVHFEKLQILTAPADEDLTIEVEIGATNISDSAVPSTIAVGLEPIEINSLDRFYKGSLSLATINRIFGGREGFGLTITGKTSENNIGFADIDDAYIHSEGYLNSDAEAAKDLEDIDPRTWQQEIIYYIADDKLHFVTTLDEIETVELKLYKNEEEQLSADYTLTSIPYVADLIQSLDQNFREAPFANNGIIPSQYIDSVNVPDYDDIITDPDPEESVVLGAEPAQPSTNLEWRNLTTRCLDAMFIEMNKRIEIIAGEIAASSQQLAKQLVAFGNGYTDGVWGGLKSDWQGLVEVKNLLLHPIDTVKTTVEGFREMLGMTVQQWKDIGNHMYSSMITNGKDALPWDLQLENTGDTVILVTYFNGYGQGFVTEQACMVFLGAGAVSKIGQTVKVILKASKLGRLGIELAEKGLAEARNIARKTKTSAQRYCSQFAENSDDLQNITAHIENTHKRPGEYGENNPSRNSQKFVGEALEQSEHLTMEKLLKELGDADDFKILNKKDTIGKRHVILFQRRSAQLLQTLIKANAYSDDAIVGFARLYKHMVKNKIYPSGEYLHDRVSDLASLFKTKLDNAGGPLNAEEIKGAKALAKSLEDYKIRSDAENFDGKFWFKEIENLYVKAYRYASWIPDEVNGVRKLNAHPANGWYVTPEKIDDAATATGRLQLPLDQPSPRYRMEIEVSEVKDNVRVPRGLQDTAEWHEPKTADYINDENFGQPGGSSQLLIDGIEVRIVEIFDFVTNQKIWPN